MTPKLREFPEVFEQEIRQINLRRARTRRPAIRLEQEAASDNGAALLRPAREANVIGLALSGGGIRSSAFCLGVLQALDANRVLDKVDYLSTVSGGGYIGTSLTAANSRLNALSFPFRSELRQHEPPGLQHIRDFSNYLFPRGIIDLFPNLVIYLRGLAANIILILPFLLFLAAYTIWANPIAADLGKAVVAGHVLPLPLKVEPFGVTQNLIALGVVVLAVWALWRSLSISGRAAEIGSWWVWLAKAVLYLIIFFAVCELQPIVLRGMFDAAQRAPTPAARAALSVDTLSKILALLTAVVGFLSRPLASALKPGAEKPGWTATLLKWAARLAVYLAGISIPFLLWVAYLYLCYWGICRNGPCAVYAPDWLLSVSSAFGALNVFGFGPPRPQVAIVWTYVVVGVVLLILSLILSPNANSLHRLYRDRLSKAFLFDPTKRQPPRGAKGSDREAPARAAAQHAMEDLVWLDDFKIQDIKCSCTPYHLINAALNIQGSKYANRRGRNADFFVFSPLFVGGEATGYVETKAMEAASKELDLATAMAISGAAASANMGANTIKPLTVTLALLNVRLGFWLPNPRTVSASGRRSYIKQFFDQFYFYYELRGELNEERDIIYLTDGGHVENLGVYELLRRRCRLIVAVDAEADPAMSFPSLMRLQRIARIDFGVIIELPWAQIRDTTRVADTEIGKSGGQLAAGLANGPHCALGEIHYPGGATGILLYVKASVTGDENDYVIDYKRRYDRFPQETTLDQLFSEEQFEAYRALGFHAMHGLLSGSDHVATSRGLARLSPDAPHGLVQETRALLL